MIEQAGEALTGATAAVEGLGAPFQVWVIPALLGLGLAASTGLRTFLPLLMLALAARFGWFGVELNDQMQWLHSDAAVAALGVAGIIVGGPTALAFNAAQGGLRLASTATTGGLGNPVVSLFEDVLAFLTALLALLAPVLVPVFLFVLAVVVFRTARRLRRPASRQSA